MAAYCRKQSCCLPQGMLLVKSVPPLLVIECGMNSSFLREPASGYMALHIILEYLERITDSLVYPFLHAMNNEWAL